MGKPLTDELGCPRCHSQMVKCDELGVYACGACYWDRDADEERKRRTREITAPHPGRNEKCPCGSGLKYKRCCIQKGRGKLLIVKF